MKGELEKRISRFLLSKYVLIHDSEKVKWAMIDVFSNMVDEARKDIFEVYNKNPTTDGEFYVCGHGRKVDLEKWLTELLETLEKWFGTGEGYDDRVTKAFAKVREELDRRYPEEEKS